MFFTSGRRRSLLFLAATKRNHHMLLVTENSPHQPSFTSKHSMNTHDWSLAPVQRSRNIAFEENICRVQTTRERSGRTRLHFTLRIEES